MKYYFYLAHLFLVIGCAHRPASQRFIAATDTPGESSLNCQKTLAALNKKTELTIEQLLQDERIKQYQGTFSKQTVQAIQEMSSNDINIVDHIVKALAVSHEYKELIQNKIVYHAIARVIVANTNNLKEANNLLESLTSTLTFGKPKQEFFDKIRLCLEIFLGSDGNPKAFINNSITERAKEVEMDKKAFEVFALFWRNVIKDDPTTFQNSLLAQMIENDQHYITKVGEVLRGKKRKINGDFPEDYNEAIYRTAVYHHGQTQVKVEIETLPLDTYKDFVYAISKIHDSNDRFKSLEFILSSLDNIQDHDEKVGILLHLMTNSINNASTWNRVAQVTAFDKIRRKCIELSLKEKDVKPIKDFAEEMSKDAHSSRVEIQRIIDLDWTSPSVPTAY